MNILHLKYAYEVAKAGSLGKAAETLLTAVPNISRAIKELESNLGIVIFDRTSKGMILTPDGEEFINYAKSILNQIENIENIYNHNAQKKQSFSISVPRASYIAEAFTEFSKSISDNAIDIFYQETNSKMVIDNIINHDYKLGIVRHQQKHDNIFKTLLDEKGLDYELICEFTYQILVSADSLLAKQEMITFDDLSNYIEITHGDPYMPLLPLNKTSKEEFNENIKRHIFVFDRASQFDLLSANKETFMWVSPVSNNLLERFNLTQKKCNDNKKIYKDFLIYKKGYTLSELDKQFITELCMSKRKYL